MVLRPTGLDSGCCGLDLGYAVVVAGEPYHASVSGQYPSSRGVHKGREGTGDRGQGTLVLSCRLPTNTALLKRQKQPILGCVRVHLQEAFTKVGRGQGTSMLGCRLPTNTALLKTQTVNNRLQATDGHRTTKRRAVKAPHTGQIVDPHLMI